MVKAVTKKPMGKKPKPTPKPASTKLTPAQQQAQIKRAIAADQKRVKTALDEKPSAAMLKKAKQAEVDRKMRAAAKRNYKNK